MGKYLNDSFGISYEMNLNDSSNHYPISIPYKFLFKTTINLYQILSLNSDKYIPNERYSKDQ